MKKPMALVLIWLLIFTQSVFPASQVIEGGQGGASSGATSPYIVEKEFVMTYDELRLTLWIATRGTTDSLDILVQTNGKNYTVFEDTTLSPWMTVLRIGPKMATGFTTVTFPTGTPARDSITPFYPRIRILSRHSADSAVAGDTSTWRIFYNDHGSKINW